MSKHFEAVIGLEIHAQLSTQSKMFCNDATAKFEIIFPGIKRTIAVV